MFELSTHPAAPAMGARMHLLWLYCCSHVKNLWVETSTALCCSREFSVASNPTLLSLVVNSHTGPLSIWNLVGVTKEISVHLMLTSLRVSGHGWLLGLVTSSIRGTVDLGMKRFSTVRRKHVTKCACMCTCVRASLKLHFFKNIHEGLERWLSG